MHRLTRYAWTVLAYNLAVILWGAFVRASGSGAGCGRHWPLCNGELVPRAPRLETLIEFSHRLTSGLSLLLVLGLLVWAFRARRKGDPTRAAAVLAAVFMLGEAAVGAGLVLFQLVAGNATLARALFMAVHLANTFFLLAALALAAHWAGGAAAPRRPLPAGLSAVLAGGAAGLLLVGASGAVAALGDTLYPAASLEQALEQDLSPTAHLLIRLRLAHPFVSLAASAGLLSLAARLAKRRRDPHARRYAACVAGLAFLQVLAGGLNVLLLAPVWLQLGHLLIADLLWIAFVLMSASALAAGPAPRPARA